ncbi:hypothetical protein PR048_008739 [Dryococelus australis]|uniref:Uncharacterized protein n=1 Tax=Dryococelus australis TaxID=614101 RepID=A0ABQ9HXY4_9NEOP|nr:hypothetical protein PR048_008739 [Dryococelus australis]
MDTQFDRGVLMTVKVISKLSVLFVNQCLILGTLENNILSQNQEKFTFGISSSGKKSATLSFKPETSKQWTIDEADKVTKAEILWTLKVVESGYSFSSCDGLADIFKQIYEIYHGLGPYFHLELVKSIKSSNNFFSLSFDEAATDAGNKQLDIHDKVINHFLFCYELGRATADILKEKLLESLSRYTLPLKKLLAIGSVGPLVNGKFLRCRGLINIGACNLHIVHSSFRWGMSDVLSHWEIDDFLDVLFKFLHKFPARKKILQISKYNLE